MPNATTVISQAKKNNNPFIDIGNCGLKELPQELFEELPPTSVLKLNVSGNKLDELPESISTLPKLISITVFSNKLTALPKTLNGLSNLKHLMASNNKITELPQGIGGCPRLVFLDLSCNRIKELRTSIGQISTLRNLHLSNNQLETLPKEIGNLKLLEYFSLRDNKLSSLPQEIGKLSSLKSLMLQGNRLLTLPRELANTSLNEEGKFLKLAGNPLVPSIVQALKTGSITALFDFMLEDTYADKTRKEAEEIQSRDKEIQAKAAKSSISLLGETKLKGSSNQPSSETVEKTTNKNEEIAIANAEYELIDQFGRPSKVDSIQSKQDYIMKSSEEFDIIEQCGRPSNVESVKGRDDPIIAADAEYDIIQQMARNSEVSIRSNKDYVQAEYDIIESMSRPSNVSMLKPHHDAEYDYIESVRKESERAAAYQIPENTRSHAHATPITEIYQFINGYSSENDKQDSKKG